MIADLLSYLADDGNTGAEVSPIGKYIQVPLIAADDQGAARSEISGQWRPPAFPCD